MEAADGRMYHRDASDRRISHRSIAEAGDGWMYHRAVVEAEYGWMYLCAVAEAKDGRGRRRRGERYGVAARSLPWIGQGRENEWRVLPEK